MVCPITLKKKANKNPCLPMMMNELSEESELSGNPGACREAASISCPPPTDFMVNKLKTK